MPRSCRAAGRERIEAQQRKDEVGGRELIRRDNDSGMRYLNYRYRHIVGDEDQYLRPACWKMLRAMAAPAPNGPFIAGDTYQRIHDSRIRWARSGSSSAGARPGSRSATGPRGRS